MKNLLLIAVVGLLSVSAHAKKTASADINHTYATHSECSMAEMLLETMDKEGYSVKRGQILGRNNDISASVSCEGKTLSGQIAVKYWFSPSQRVLNLGWFTSDDLTVEQRQIGVDALNKLSNDEVRFRFILQFPTTFIGEKLYHRFGKMIDGTVSIIK